MNYYKKDDQTNLFNQQIKYYDASLKGIEEVKTILKSFDGKQVNKRLYDKLPECYDLRKDGITYYNQDFRSVQETKKDNFGCSCWNYISYDTVYFGRYTGTNYNMEFIKDGRLIYENIEKMIDANVLRIQELIKTLKEELKRADAAIAQKTELSKRIEDFNNSLSYETRQYFNLTIDVRR